MVGGYRRVRCPDHPGADSYGYVLEHRLVAERSLGRLLLPDEVVHHIDGDKLHNVDDNLQVMTRTEHLVVHGRVPAPGKWALHHEACVRCGSTRSKHKGHGLCNSCYVTLQQKTKRSH